VRARVLESSLGRLSDPALTLLVLGCTAAGIGAFLLDVAGIVRMPWTISFVSLPALVLVIAIAVWARRVARRPFFNRLVVGLVAGLIATLAYDGVRWAIQETAPLDYDGFRSINIFGSLILAKPETAPLDYDGFRSINIFGSLILSKPETALDARIAGWTYHFWNGISFGVMYALVAGPARWYWGLAWGVALELMMISIYPVAFAIQRSDPAFLAISMTGHAAYGAVLGLLAERWCDRDPLPVRRVAW